tara:strand:- start:990 stop:1193 length:204 start_codon:yes stop_codon:yes gene_type:complete
MTYLKVQGRDNLVKNSRTNFVVNTNRSEYDEYKSRQKKAESMEEDLAELKSEMNEIKQLLRSLVNGN